MGTGITKKLRCYQNLVTGYKSETDLANAGSNRILQPIIVREQDVSFALGLGKFCTMSGSSRRLFSGADSTEALLVVLVVCEEVVQQQKQPRFETMNTCFLTKRAHVLLPKCICMVLTCETNVSYATLCSMLGLSRLGLVYPYWCCTRVGFGPGASVVNPFSSFAVAAGDGGQLGTSAVARH
eukprot:2671847-Amphidinium_carterae.1